MIETGSRKSIAVLAGSRAECRAFARDLGANHAARFSTAEAEYRMYVEQVGAEGISADDLLKIGTYQKRFDNGFIRMAEIGCEMHRERRYRQ